MLSDQPINTAALRRLCEAASAGAHTYAESEFHAAWTPEVAISALDLIDRQAQEATQNQDHWVNLCSILGLAVTDGNDLVGCVTKAVEQQARRIELAGGYHERTDREIEIEAALAETQPGERDSADRAIAELLELVDAGRNRLYEAMETIDQQAETIRRLEAEIEDLKSTIGMWGQSVPGASSAAGMQEGATMSDRCPTELIYLAIPYSHPDPDVREQRFREANRYAGRLMQAGLLVFSPISHTHPIAVDCELPKGFDFWERYDRVYLEICRAIVVVCLPGWEESKGVQAEIKIMDELIRPVWYVQHHNNDCLRATIRALGGNPDAR